MQPSEIRHPSDHLTDWHQRFSSSARLCQRVDLLGPPAAGKSTLCKAVFARLVKEQVSGWIGLQDAKGLAIRNALENAIPKRSIKTRVSELLRAVRDALSAYEGNPETNPYHSRSLDSLQEHLMEAFALSNHIYLDALAEQWHDPDTPLPPRFERFHLVREWIKELLLIASFIGKMRVLADNARLTKGMAELLSNPRFSDAESIVSQYCRSPLAPTGIIHLSATVETANQRSKQRQSESGRLNPGHASRSDAEMKSYTERKNKVNKEAVRYFESRGIAVLNLSAESDLNKNVDKVMLFIQGIHGAQNNKNQA